MKTPIRGGFRRPILLLFALAACGQSAATSNEVSMAESDFSATSVTHQGRAGGAFHRSGGRRRDTYRLPGQ